MDALERPVTALKGVGKQKAQELAKLDIQTVGDLLEHYPFRYEDRAHLKPLAQLSDQVPETVLGQVVQTTVVPYRGRGRMLNVLLQCETGSITLVWFNQHYLKDKLSPGTRLIATGKVSGGRKRMAVQDFEILDETDDGASFQRIIPVHRATEKLSAKWLRALVEQALTEYGAAVTEHLPEELCRKYRLMPLAEATQAIHFPNDWSELNLARYRLVMDEFTVMLLGLRAQQITGEEKVGISHQPTEGLTNRFLKQLPFRLTNAQRRVILEIKADMESARPMQRLVQGDVGSGKTMIAVYVLLKAAEGGYQSALMAPTEILAEQHYLTLKPILEPLGVELALLKGSLSAAEKNQIVQGLADGTITVAVGTHALIQKSVSFCNLGAIVIDEQHRFGVKQRLALENKGLSPDVLVMTATPIPRSLALTIYGDLDLSVIDELPPGRKPIITYHVGERKRQGMYGFIGKELAQGHQAYVVCPLIEESEKMDLENASALAEKLAKEIYPQYQVGLLHGKMTTAEKMAVMEDFRSNKLQILVSTTVIEVGVDVPNANIMVIENAERFGLAQLHQLRGRVGRGSAQSYCILMAEARTDEAKRRMEIMVKSSDGFVIAEEDLALRGPGEVLGVRQSGLPDFKIADLVQDIRLLERSKLLAADILQDGLEQEKYAPLRERIDKVYQRKVRLKEE